MPQVAEHATTEVRDADEVICPTLHHIGITTNRFEEMLAFYEKLIGMVPVRRLDMQRESGMAQIAFLTNDRANHRITLIHHSLLKEIGGRSNYARAGQHIAFEYDTIDDLFHSYKRIKRLGIHIGLCEAHGTSTNMYLHDPDGNTVELRIDNFSDWDKSTEFLRNTADPRGAGPVDFDAMIAARDAGATPEELYERAVAGEFPPSHEPDLSVHS